ncbi:selenium metabolism-associated LysR family transcriptional regulator [Neobacillus sp. SM06]|uniref:selenium metabolism-associated LysR family transcriptional regulator n=1 Tax=Neobacillus sp. SM06 TaxID=3422492 RepID=UPI003D29F073
MNLKKLEAFMFVVEKKSFSEAAFSLKSSQPALSLKIKSLEDDLGVNLLERGLAGVQPTAAGKIVYQAAKDIMKRWITLEDELHSLQDVLSGTLTVGASTIPGTYLLPPLLKEFRHKFPKVEVVVVIDDSKKMIEKLLDRQIDIAIVGLKQESSKIKFKQVASDSLVLITPIGHPLVQSKDLNFNEIQRFDFVVREEGSGTRKVMEEFLIQQGYALHDIKAAVSIGSTDAVIAAVEAGLGISFISKLAAATATKANRIEIIEPVIPFSRNFYFAALPEEENRPIIKAFSDILPQKN